MRWLLALAAGALWAQQPVPHAGYIYPAGGRRGDVLQVRIGGQYLTGANQVYCTGSGVSVQVKSYTRPPTGAEMQKLREELPSATPERRAEIREKLEDFNRRRLIPAIAEVVVLEVIIAPDAAAGPRTLRLDTNAGLTNPVAFQVGDLPEFTRKPARVPRAFEAAGGATPVARPARRPDPPTEITLPAVLNGQMMPGSADRYRYRARKGQHLAITVQARTLLPYISDAVPGWFQAALALRDAKGREVQAADHYFFDPDPRLEYTVPEDGEYTAEIHDSIYRGREDFVYRLTIAQAAPKPAPPRSRKVQQKVKLPANLEGRILQPGEVHRFRFQGNAGEVVAAEVTARRIGSPLDSFLRLTNAKGKLLASNDDFEDRGAGLLTHQADSHLLYKLPAKGAYYLELSDAQRKAGPEWAYRLRISAPRPDFELRVAPSSLNLRVGATVPVTVCAIRRDGFSGEIALSLKDAPAGFRLSGASIPAGQDTVRVTLTAPRMPVAAPASLQLTGEAAIDGRPVTHAAVPAEDMEQAFAYHHLVPQDAWMVRVIGQGRGGVPWRPMEKRIRLVAGSATTFDLFVPPALQKQATFALNAPPEGIAIESARPTAGGVSLVLKVEKARPGLQGNLIVDAFREVQRRRQPLGTLPAIPFEVVEK